jgi:hypothetical protein
MKYAMKIGVQLNEGEAAQFRTTKKAIENLCGLRMTDAAAVRWMIAKTMKVLKLQRSFVGSGGAINLIAS